MMRLFRYFDPENEGFITMEKLKKLTAREGRKLKEEDL
jgi:hypothetical protein